MRPPTSPSPPGRCQRPWLFHRKDLGILVVVATLATMTPAKSPESPSAWNGTMPSFLYTLRDQRAIAQTVEKVSLDSRTAQPVTRAETPLKCMRIHSASSGELACMTQIVPQGLPNAGKLSPPMVYIYSADLRILYAHPATGNTPSRVQMSADGSMVGFTSFTSGTSYADGAGVNFMTSTRVGPADKPDQTSNLKDWRLLQDGKVLRSPNVQYWGVSFLPQNSNFFYVTVYINDARHIARGDVRQRELVIIFTGAECPSVSPDGTRIAVKRQISRTSWRPAVITLDTLAVTEFDVKDFVDDQIVWFNNGVLMFQVSEAPILGSTKQHTDTLDTRNGSRARAKRLLERSRSTTAVFGKSQKS